MQSNITIKFLSEKDMENAKKMDWRYEHVGSGNLGFADKVKNRVFIKSGLDAEVTKYLIDHEISHLFEMKGTDEDEYGIRHKRGFMNSGQDKIERERREAAEQQARTDAQIASYGSGHWETRKQGDSYWVADDPAINAQLGAQREAGTKNEGSWFQESWKQLKPLVYYLAANLGGYYAGGAMGNLFGGGADAAGSGAGSAAGTMGGQAGTATAGGVGSGIGGQVASQAGQEGANAFMQITPSAAPAIGQQTSSFMQGNSSDFMNALGKLFTGGSQDGNASYTPSNDFQMPKQSQTQSQPSFFTGSYGAGMPDMGGNYGQTGLQTSTGVGEMSGLSKMPMNPGLGQAGIALGGTNNQGGQGGAYDQMFQGQEYDPIGFNQSNGGQFSF